MNQAGKEVHWRWTDELTLQRHEGRYLLMQRPRGGAVKTDPFLVVEVPIEASDQAFMRALRKALPMLGAGAARAQAARTRKLRYFRKIVNDTTTHLRLSNALAREDATVHFQVRTYPGLPQLAESERLEIGARWKGEIAHREELPIDTDPIVVAKRLRRAFDLAARHPRHRFRFGTRIWVYRIDDQYFFEDLCLAGGDLEVHGLRQLPVKTGDGELGAALLAAITDFPRLTSEQYLRHRRRELPGAAIIRSTRAYLFWDGIRTPDRLSFAIVRPDASMETPVTVSVNATAATVGKLVRTVFLKKIGAAKRGFSNAELHRRLDRLGYFDFCKRKAAARAKFVENGWLAALVHDVGRSFIADSEDLAEGGVGRLLRDMEPFFARIGIEHGRVRDELRADGYDVHIGDKCYPILVPDDFSKEARGWGNLWGVATYRTATVLDLLLRMHGREELAYSVDGGNQHSFLLITPGQHALLRRGRGYDVRSGPYRSTGQAPNYGMIEY